MKIFIRNLLLKNSILWFLLLLVCVQKDLRIAYFCFHFFSNSGIIIVASRYLNNQRIYNTNSFFSICVEKFLFGLFCPILLLVNCGILKVSGFFLGLFFRTCTAIFFISTRLLGQFFLFVIVNWILATLGLHLSK